MNGKPGDHPVKDICDYRLEVYGTEADGLIRKVAALSNQQELYEWWEKELGWRADAEEALPKARARHRELLGRARERGWETDRHE